MVEFAQVVLSGLVWGSVIALIALGYTMVYGVLKLINFAHSDVFMIGAFSGMWLASSLRAEEDPNVGKVVFVIVGAMIICAMLGMTIEKLAYRPLRMQPRLSALITAIGVSLFLENLGQILFSPNPQHFPTMIPQRIYTFGGLQITNIAIIILLVCLGLMLLLRWIVLNTKVGKAMRAVSFDTDAANLMGISPDRIITFTFALGSSLAAAGGCLISLQNDVITVQMGILPGLKAFVAAVLGGIGNIPGALLGGLTMGVAEYIVKSYGLSQWEDAVAFVILVVILLLRPTGILGSRAAEKV
jgi:branched-chain amino acid transport system permease protein